MERGQRRNTCKVAKRKDHSNTMTERKNQYVPRQKQMVTITILYKIMVSIVYLVLIIISLEELFHAWSIPITSY